ncbi:unnamed protein product [Kuraishia capsulata CBS 1993]|uniref:LicD/FKTN/FKRP nucleotidyltransferase domain-containing protein n=1 Tax=Kuraishia capsulata CBS 1993 TaxID=1382522 RepID=W6MX74_9ASCO|nr:uncharacterized protein KUCA_T00004377001 [Kuraishia capsulata CBS 1993]CDK28395.1 unnamed protein product [Kuraishia capsulata CBS 1993]
MIPFGLRNRRRRVLTRRNLVVATSLITLAILLLNNVDLYRFRVIHHEVHDTQPITQIDQTARALMKWEITSEAFRNKNLNGLMVPGDDDLSLSSFETELLNKAHQVGGNSWLLNTLPHDNVAVWKPKEFEVLPRFEHSFDRLFWNEHSPESLQNTEHILSYDPRFTLSLYLNYIRKEFLMKNPKNERNPKADSTIRVPFSWTDWTDFTYLNPFITRPPESKVSCEELISRANGNEAEGFCTNAADITSEMLSKWKLPSVDALPGFAVTKYISTRTNPEDMLLVSKTYLLTSVPPPARIMFQAKGGSYQVLVDGTQKAIESELMDSYLFEHGLTKESDKIPLNAMEEFDKLISEIPPRYAAQPQLAQILNPETQNRLHLIPEMFEFGTAKVEKILAECEAKVEAHEIEFDNWQNGLVTEDDYYSRFFMPENEVSYCKNLRVSYDLADQDLGKFFFEAQLTMPLPNSDNGHHYDFRFYAGGFSQKLHESFNEEQLTQRKRIVLQRLIRNWLSFTYDQGIVQWIAHGSLLAWYWDGMTFPWDMDTDVQMPVTELDRFGKLYNQTLVVEDPREGYGKFFIDCGTFSTHRVKGNGNNNIDARFIDVDSGTFIDITGLAITNTKMPVRYHDYANRWKQAYGEESTIPVFNCRNNHFYSFDEISPMRLTMMEGVPTAIPNKIKDMLIVEYKKGLARSECEHFNFVEKLGLWIHEDKIKKILPHTAYEEEDGKFSIDRFASWVNELSDEQVIQLLDYPEISTDYLKTHKLSRFHRQEMKAISSTHKQTDALFGHIKMYEPLRMTLFDWLNERQ